jgi:hypothetical protein
MWCEARSVLPLTYLMHCWPMCDSGPATLRRLGETMQELRRHHADQLDAYGFQTLCQMADLIEDLIGRAAESARFIAIGRGREQCG